MLSLQRCIPHHRNKRCRLDHILDLTTISHEKQGRISGRDKSAKSLTFKLMGASTACRTLTG
jgi:hypothetical protein